MLECRSATLKRDAFALKLIVAQQLSHAHAEQLLLLARDRQDGAFALRLQLDTASRSGVVQAVNAIAQERQDRLGDGQLAEVPAQLFFELVLGDGFLVARHTGFAPATSVIRIPPTTFVVVLGDDAATTMPAPNQA